MRLRLLAALLLAPAGLGAQQPAAPPLPPRSAPPVISTPPLTSEELRAVDANLARQLSLTHLRVLEAATQDFLAAARRPERTEASMQAALDQAVTRHAAGWSATGRDSLRVGVLARASRTLADEVAALRSAGTPPEAVAALVRRRQIERMQDALAIISSLSRRYHDLAKSVIGNIRAD